MKKILKNIYYADNHHGVLVGAITTKQGIILVDSPLLTDSVRSYLTDLEGLEAGEDRLIIYLDAHPDRSLGAKLMETRVMAQKHTFDAYKKRSAVFKGNKFETGSDWEFYSGFPGIRWEKPSMSFSEKVELHWGDMLVIAEHHPGPQPGACWVVIPEKKVAFIGDAVMVKQPPFFADANIPEWIEMLDLMLSDEYKDYRFYSSRCGKVDEKDIKTMRKFLLDTHKKLERIAKRKGAPEDTEKLINRMLDNINPPAKQKVTYEYRLRYGLKHYYINQYVVDDAEDN